MAIKNRPPLHTTTRTNIPTPTSAQSDENTILEHILLCPDTYIGSVEKQEQTLWVWQNEQMIKRPISFVPGLYKIFDDILLNAADNTKRNPRLNTIKVEIDVQNSRISVWNNGDGIPVIARDDQVFVPELVFGNLSNNSKYGDLIQKATGGCHEYDVKLANVFSIEFTIETADGRRAKKYRQVFANNMRNKSKPTITKCKRNENWMVVAFKPDLTKFGMEYLEDDTVALMKRRVVDLAGCLGNGVKVELNGTRVPLKTFKDYAKLYLGTSMRIYGEANCRWEVCVSVADGDFEQVSFVNNIATMKGGSHVDYITDQITSNVAAIVNKQNKHANLKPTHIKTYLWIFVKALIDNAAFDSQTKENLTTKKGSFGSTCELTTGFLEKVANSDVVNRYLDFKSKEKFKKADIKTKGKLNIPKLEDAKMAATADSGKCTLILTEGDSAKALAMAGLSVVGQDYYGVFPLRGKLLNVRDASPRRLLLNAEIQDLKKILGLQHGKNYENVKELRYGHLMIMADQDEDGSHIKGLLLNFIHWFWPSLLKLPNFMLEFITPIVKATDRKTEKVLSFYTMPEYWAWMETLGSKATQYKIKYYKGLGTSESKEGVEYFADLDHHVKDFVWADDEDGDAIDLAFSRKRIADRKVWLQELEAVTYLDSNLKHIPIRDFVHKDLRLFSKAHVKRSIPSMVDGLKPSQRKVLFCAFKKPITDEMRVSQFSGYVSEHSAYHHGEESLIGTIIHMAQNFVGSNNINLLLPIGQFGTRIMGGKDHASGRYLYTQLSPITRFIFHKADELLLNYLNDDGQSIEPRWFLPIIPMVLVNGCAGIGTAWSSSIPNYHPRDIIENLKRLLNGEAMVPMDPWYRGYDGFIIKTTPHQYTTTGIIREVGDYAVRIFELPIGMWTDDFKNFLEEALVVYRKGKIPLIRGYRSRSDTTKVDFVIMMSTNQIELGSIHSLDSMKKLKLTTTLSTSNMHLLDASGEIKKYDTPEQILEDFFHFRLDFYEERRKNLLRELEIASLKLKNKVRFIREVDEGTIVLSNKKKADVCAELKKKGFTPFPKIAGAVNEGSEETEEEEEVLVEYDYLLSISFVSLTHGKMLKLQRERDAMENNFNELANIPARSLWLRDLNALDRALHLSGIG